MFNVLAQSAIDAGADYVANMVVGGVFAFLALMFTIVFRFMLTQQKRADMMSADLREENRQLRDDRDRYMNLYLDCEAKDRGY